MRLDMRHLLLDTGRGMRLKRNRQRERNCSDYWDVTSERMFTPRAHGQYSYRREFCDRLSPLYRYLEKNCGRPWNDVFSEMCQHIDLRTIRGYHLWTHIDSYVYWINDPLILWYKLMFGRLSSHLHVDGDYILQKGE